MIQRTPSESAASSAASSSAKKWRFGSALRKMQSRSSTRDDKPWHRSHTTSSDNDPHDSSLSLRHADTHASSLLNDSTESSYRQLHALVQRMRNAPSGPSHIDASYKEFSKIKDRCSALCYTILKEEIRSPGRQPSNAHESILRRDSSMDGPLSPGTGIGTAGFYDQRSSFSGRSFADVGPTGANRSGSVGDAWLGAIRDWKACLDQIAESFKTNLAETYRNYERDATQEMVDNLFLSKKYRRDAINRMRNASVTRVMSADPSFFPRYDIRFRNYDRVKDELRDIRSLLQSAESGISPERQIQEYTISAHGDAILEFANISAECSPDDPVLRFRISSHMLVEASPIFGRMFTGLSSRVYQHDDEDITDQIAPPATKYVCKDGSEANLYRMPQRELNRHHSLDIFLHAAHMHNERVPRDVSFEQFVAIAECSLRYKCTSPLELMVEHRWLPQWMHRGADDMPDGLLVISYAFGSRGLFTRMSKSAILNLVDEQDLQSKPWPRKIRDKIWAIRCAKMAQVYACCTDLIQEYIRGASPNAEEVPVIEEVQPRNSWFSYGATLKPVKSLTTSPRCPKGSHWCDATNMGWLMLAFNEMNLLSHILQPAVLSHINPANQPSRSLSQIVFGLRRTPSPEAPIHGGICDPTPAFRSALDDIYNSISGLTLYDISGKSHGWALSKHMEDIPQSKMHGIETLVADESNHVTTELAEDVRLRILSEIDNPIDLQSAAMTNRAFYDTYRTHELSLMRNIVRSRHANGKPVRAPVPMSTSNAEEKVLGSESQALKERSNGPESRFSDVEEDDDESDEAEDGDDSDDGVITNDTRAPPMSDPFRRHSGPTQTRTEPSPSQTNGVDTSIPVRGTNVVAVSEYDEPETPPMTDEEALRILWPDHTDYDNNNNAAPVHRFSASRPLNKTAATTTTTLTTATGTATASATIPLGEKFRLGDTSFFTESLLEEKTLVVTGDKQLRSEHDRRMGLLKHQRQQQKEETIGNGEGSRGGGGGGGK